MSHAYGKVYRNNVVAAHYEYDGTSDIALPRMYLTSDEVKANWRKGSWVECTCGEPSVPVVLYTDYGYGSHWDGKACFKCIGDHGRHRHLPGRHPHAQR